MSHLERIEQKFVGVMRRGPSSSGILRAVLGFAFVYHGVWNLGSEAGVYWKANVSLYPEGFRYVVGILEILLALGLVFSRTRWLAALGLGLIMLGAVFSNFQQGYSYKDLGVEVPVAYLAMIWVLLRSEERP